MKTTFFYFVFIQKDTNKQIKSAEMKITDHSNTTSAMPVSEVLRSPQSSCHLQVSINNVFLAQTCSKYIRERGEVEKEYARSLRRLSTKYGSKEGDREERGTEKAFR